jgi:crotonobetainyl-CoA:carnitine CoA-transferase CaiB-like acyl-CoA transferase
MTGIVGLLGCLMRAKSTGQGCDVDTNLFDVATHQHCYLATWYLNSGTEPQRVPRSAHASIAPVQSVRTKDGWIYVMCMKEKFWETLAQKIGRDDLVTDPRFCNQDVRRANRHALTTELDAAMGLRTTEEWLAVLTGAIPVAPIYSVRDAFSSRFMAEAGMVTSVRHPAEPNLQVLASPLKIDGQRPERSACAPLSAGNAHYLAEIASRRKELA